MDAWIFRRYVWCGRVDSNHHALASASPSSWCVCQFRHDRKGLALLLRTAWLRCNPEVIINFIHHFHNSTFFGDACAIPRGDAAQHSFRGPKSRVYSKLDIFLYGNVISSVWHERPPLQTPLTQ